MALTRALEAPATATRRRLDPETDRLVGSRCEACGAVSWPGRAVCQRCGEARMVEAAFGPAGSLLSFTTVWVERPGIEAPYTLAQVKLEDGPLVFAHVRNLAGDARVPFPVRLVVVAEEATFPPFWVEPEADQQ